MCPFDYRVIDEDLKPFAIAMQTFTGNVFGKYITPDYNYIYNIVE